jgi:hypothetical protein
MRGWGRKLAFGFLLTLFAGVGAVAQLPPSSPEPLSPKETAPAARVRDQLKTDLAALLGDKKDVVTADDVASERARLQAKLQELLYRINNPRPSPSTGPKVPIAPKPRVEGSLSDSKSIDPIREGMNRFRDNDFDIALAVFRMIDPNILGPEDHAFVQYMRACCLRRLNKLNEAANLYREVADAHENDFITECAIWQLSLIRSQQELEAQIEQLRARTKTR